LKHIFLIVVVSLFAAPLWAGYGLSNVVTKKLDAQQAPAPQAAPVPGEAQPQETAPAAVQNAEKQPASLEFKTVYYPYTIHISSFKTQKEAVSDYEKKYQKMDMTYVTKIDLGDSGIWYRVDHGAFSNVNDAMKKMKEMKNGGIITDSDAFVGSSSPYTIELGVFSSNNEAMIQARKLQEKGQVPYIIKESAEVYRLLYGAYPSEKSALPARQDLKAMGLQTKITKR
jgi:septal ring-binding cell division protein DamX